jgi:hypothetical protein
LHKLIEHLAPGSRLEKRLASITDHDHRAAVICALSAMCVAKEKFVAVGDPRYGDIMLPPQKVWGCDSTGQSRWAETALQESVTCLVNLPKPRVIGDVIARNEDLGRSNSLSGAAF